MTWKLALPLILVLDFSNFCEGGNAFAFGKDREKLPEGYTEERCVKPDWRNLDFMCSLWAFGETYWLRQVLGIPDNVTDTHVNYFRPPNNQYSMIDRLIAERSGNVSDLNLVTQETVWQLWGPNIMDNISVIPTYYYPSGKIGDHVECSMDSQHFDAWIDFDPDEGTVTFGQFIDMPYHIYYIYAYMGWLFPGVLQGFQVYNFPHIKNFFEIVDYRISFDYGAEEVDLLWLTFDNFAEKIFEKNLTVPFLYPASWIWTIFTDVNQFEDTAGHGVFGWPNAYWEFATYIPPIGGFIYGGPSDSERLARSENITRGLEWSITFKILTNSSFNEYTTFDVNFPDIFPPNLPLLGT